MTENTHALTTLTAVIKRSVAAMKVYSEELKKTPSKVLLDRVLDESSTLSSGVAALARAVSLDTLDTPEQADGPLIDIDAVSDLLRRMAALEGGGVCPECQGVLPE